MRILAVDTSTMAGGVAILDADHLLCDLQVVARTSHAPPLLALIHQAVSIASIPLESIDLLAVSRGPGSFTGLRIGIATLTGLGYALRRPVVGVDTLEAVAMKVPFARYPVCSLLDARKGEVYGACFRVSEHGLQRLTPNLVEPPEAFCAHITEPTLLIGPGVEVYRDVWETRLGDLVVWAPPWMGMPCSVEVGALAFAQAMQGPEGVGPTLTPTYVRLSDAELNWALHRGPESPSI